MTRVEKIKRLIGAACFFVIAFCAWTACSDNTTSNNTSSTTTTAPEDKTAYPEGKTIYLKTCVTCHQSNGTGSTGTYPPLANSDYLLADKYRAIHQVLKGSSAKYTVNGNDYEGVMPPQGLSDDEVVQVLNYVYHSWGNNGFTITTADVKVVSDTIIKR